MLLKYVLILSVTLSATLAIGGNENPTSRNFFYPPDDEANQLSVLTPRQTTINYRLPNDTKPIHYDISISTAIHTADLNFDGTVIIEIVAVEATNLITLHIMRNTVLNVKFWDANQRVILDTNSSYTFEVERDFMRVPLPETLVIGQRYFIEVIYKGILRNDDAGFYVSTYVGPSNEIRYLATTKFERTDARHAFPGYDEPGIRATYTLRITHDASYNAISNMPGQRRAGPSGTVTTEFERSPSMQTYLLAFVVSDFTFITNENYKAPSEKLHYVYARPAYVTRGDAQFALDAGINLLAKIEGIVLQSYTLPKMTQISIPDFAAGAMENWGLVAYRESTLLYNRNTQAMTQEKTVATVISHEFSHMFFGNWVSPVWWDFIWLNEGFATLFEYYGAQASFPDRGYWDLFISEVLHYVMDRDDTLTVRPMTYYVEAPLEINRLFDFIAYDKSGSVLRMFMYAFGEQTFLKGLNYYLTEMNDKAANSKDLSRNLQKAAREDNTIPSGVMVEDILHSWSEQSGFPYLYVTRNSTTRAITVSQYRMLSVAASDAERGKMWWVPYNFAFRGQPNFGDTGPDGWMTNSQQSITINPSPAKDWSNKDWVVFNKQQTSYYRVDYDSVLWNLIIEELHDGNFNLIHYSNRAQLLEDAFKWAALNTRSYDQVMGLLSYMHKEFEYLPWSVFNKHIGNINLYLSGSSEYEEFRTFIREKIEPYYRSLGPANRPTDKLYERQGRIIAMNYACRMGSALCRNETSQKLEMHLNPGNNEVDIDIRAQVYCNGLRGANTDLFLRVWNKMLTTTDQTLRNLITTGLGCSEDPALLQTLLSTTVDGTSNYAAGDRGRVINAAFGNTNIGLEATLTFIERSYAKIHEFYDGAMPLSSVFAAMGQRIVNDEQFIRFKTLEQMLVPTYVTMADYNTGISRAEANFVFISRHRNDIISFVSKYNSASGLALSVLCLALTVFTILFR